MTLSLEQIRRMRFHAQGLHGESTDVAEVVRRLFALQSQELSSARLAIRARSNGLTVDDVRKAREIDRTIVLTWTLRGTMHLVAAEDVGWQLGLVGATNIRQTNSRYKQLGLTEAIRQRANELMPEILREHGPLTRAELAEQLAKHDIPVEGQAIHHLVRCAALSGVVCFGPEKQGELTYVGLDDWLHDKNQHDYIEEDALSELARRYLHGYAPATMDDFIRWSGLGVRQAKAAIQYIADEWVEVDTVLGDMMVLEQQLDTQLSEVPIRLLPRYDNYILGYADRHFMVDEAYVKEIHPGGGLIRTSVIVDGCAKGIWKLERKGNVILQPFEYGDRQEYEAEIQDIRRFLNIGL